MAFSVLQHRALDEAAAGLLSNVDIRVRHELAGLRLATLYSDRNGSSTFNNPTIGGFFSDGKIRCYLAAGRYRVDLLVSGVVVDTFYDVPVGTASEFDHDGAGNFTQTIDFGQFTPNGFADTEAERDSLYGEEDEFFSVLVAEPELPLTGPHVFFLLTPHPTTPVWTSGYQFSASGANGVVHNHLHNGDFHVWQRGTVFRADTVPLNSDGNYLPDRWKLLSDGNDVVDVTREASVVPSGGLYAIALDVETINKKFAIWQVLEQKDCVGLIGSQVTLSFKLKVSATTKLDNVKAAIIAWDGTADAPTADPISAWGAEGTNPTLVANYTYENSPANLNPTTSYATYSVTANVDTASAKNVAVMIWSDVTDTTLGDFLYITDVQLEPGTTAAAFARKTAQQNLADCQRYFFRRQSQSSSDEIGSLQAFSTSAAAGKLFDLPVQMRVSPTVTVSNISHLAALSSDGSAVNVFTGGSFNKSTPTSIGGSPFTGSSGLLAGGSTAIRFNTAAGYIDASAEL